MSMDVWKDREAVHIRLQKNTKKVLEESKLLNLFSINHVLNWAISLGIPRILNDKGLNNEELERLSKIADDYHKRQLNVSIRAQIMSKATFLDRVVKKFRHLFRLKIEKEHFLEIIDAYIEESKSFSDNEKVTNYLIDWKNYLTKSKKNFELEKAWFTLQFDNLHKEKLIKEKVKK